MSGAPGRHSASASPPPSPRSRLLRLDDRFAARGPLALLRDVPQLGLLLIASIFLAASALAFTRRTPPRPVAAAGPVSAPSQPTGSTDPLAAPVTRVGPVDGTPVPGYVDAARASWPAGSPATRPRRRTP